jgi:hypothetical protein
VLARPGSFARAHPAHGRRSGLSRPGRGPWPVAAEGETFVSPRATGIGHRGRTRASCTRAACLHATRVVFAEVGVRRLASRRTGAGAAKSGERAGVAGGLACRDRRGREAPPGGAGETAARRRPWRGELAPRDAGRSENDPHRTKASSIGSARIPSRGGARSDLGSTRPPGHGDPRRASEARSEASAREDNARARKRPIRRSGAGVVKRRPPGPS